ncbi:MAG: rRNA pseudouridine synthase [Spirochaetaceae bacterium]|nr:rRNA pseudouridine synthase [Spirochaetaceae bacterium]
MTTERLDKVLSHHGFGTRKDTRRLIRSGAVTVDGKPCFVPDTHIPIETAQVFVDGELLQLRRHIYLMMNKPAGVVCSTKDGLHKTVFDLLKDEHLQVFLGGSLHLVGRLDIDTEGLLLLTTDGTLTHRLTSPRTNIRKTYFVRLEQYVPEEARPLITRRFADGIHIEPEGDDGEWDCKAAELDWLEGDCCLLKITEGRYHQVKRMIAAAGNKVIYLRRDAIGQLQLDSELRCGEYRNLTSDELDLLV